MSIEREQAFQSSQNGQQILTLVLSRPLVPLPSRVQDQLENNSVQISVSF